MDEQVAFPKLRLLFTLCLSARRPNRTARPAPVTPFSRAPRLRAAHQPAARLRRERSRATLAREPASVAMGARTTVGLLLLSLAVRTAVAGPLAQFMQKGSKEAHCHHRNVGTTAGSPMDCNRYTWPQGLAYPPPKIAAAERHPVMLVPSMIGSCPGCKVATSGSRRSALMGATADHTEPSAAR